MIEHVTCFPGDDNYREFLRLPSLLYPDHGTNKIAGIPLHYLLTCIIVYKEKKPVARLALYNNPYLKYNDREILLAGAFDSINDTGVVQYLFKVADSVALQHQKKFIVGPMNGSTWEDYRLPLAFDHSWFFTETACPAFYPDLWRHAGFEIFHRYYSSSADITIEQKPVLPAGIRNLQLSKFEEELSGLHDLCLAAFAQNIFFSPIEKETFIAKYRQVERLIDEELVLIAENKNGNAEAFVLCLPDILDASRSTLIFKTLVKHPSGTNKGLITVMLEELVFRASQKGYTKMIHAFMHEENRSNKLSRLFGGEVFREYVLFIKPVNDRHS
jgi:hypothetical protein